MKPILITDEGKALISAAAGGEAPIRFSRICTYDAEKNIMQSTPVSGISRDGIMCAVYGLIDNSEVRGGYCIEGLGLFAETNSGEVLFGFCEENSDPFYMPAGAENSRTEVTLRISLTAECSDKIILRPDSDAYASAVQLYDEIARLDDEISQKTAVKIAELKDRIEVMETVLQSGLTGNTAVVGFSDLEGVEFNGIWNFNKKRIEF